MKTNVAIKSPSPRTHEGGIASRTTAAQELERTVMACLLWENTFYESGVDVAVRIYDLVQKCKPEDVERIMVKASTEYKLRHAPLWMAIASLPEKKVSIEAIASVVNRADSLTEILNLYWLSGKKPLSHHLKKALDLAIRKFNEYAFAKYDRKGAIRLRDVFRIVRPKASNEEQNALWGAVVKGNLKAPDTWEVALSAGKDKKETWERLLSEKTLGDLAFLRNLRNMESVSVDRDKILASFKDRKWAKILPYQFIAAAKYAPSFERQLDDGMQKALADMERLPGKTAILIDVSGSMSDHLSSKSEITRWDAGVALAMLLEGVCEDLRVFQFNTSANEVPVRKGFGLRSAIRGPNGGTKMWKAIKTLPEGFDRVIVITDEQTVDNGHLSSDGPMYYILNVATDKNGVGYGKRSVHISGFSEASVRYIMEYEKESN